MATARLFSAPHAERWHDVVHRRLPAYLPRPADLRGTLRYRLPLSHAATSSGWAGRTSRTHPRACPGGRHAVDRFGHRGAAALRLLLAPPCPAVDHRHAGGARADRSGRETPCIHLRHGAECAAGRAPGSAGHAASRPAHTRPNPGSGRAAPGRYAGRKTVTARLEPTCLDVALRLAAVDRPGPEFPSGRYGIASAMGRAGASAVGSWPANRAGRILRPAFSRGVAAPGACPRTVAKLPGTLA